MLPLLGFLGGEPPRALFDRQVVFLQRALNPETSGSVVWRYILEYP